MEIFIDKKREEDQRQTNKQTNEQTKKRNKRKIEKKKRKDTIHISNRGKHREIPSRLLKQFDWIGIDWPLSCEPALKASPRFEPISVIEPRQTP